MRTSSYSTQIIKESYCRSRFALFGCNVAIRRKGEGLRSREPSRVPLKQLKLFLKKRKLRKRIRNYASQNLPRTSRVYQIILTPFLRKRVLFGNGERMTEVNDNKMV